MTVKCLLKSFLIFIAALLLSLPLQGQRKKVGLVLSGGGAKGAAHIGVLKVLEEAKIPIDYIAGTSMGAIVGGLYAIGYSAHELDSLVRTQEWTTLLSDGTPRQSRLISDRAHADQYLVSLPLDKKRRIKISTGIVGGQSVYNLLNTLTLGYHDSISFDSLPIPFACVAYDVVKGEEVVFRSGDLPKAIRASMSVPGAFSPVVDNGRVLIDGGMSNNMPVDVVRKMGADVVITVDLASGMIKAEDFTSIVDVVDQITTIMGAQAYNRNLKNIDLYIKPEIAPYTFASFTSQAIDSLIVRGEVAARASYGKMLSLRDSLNIPADFKPKNIVLLHNPHVDSVMIGKVDIVGLEPKDEAIVRKMIRLKDHQKITVARLNDVVDNLRGSGLFNNVSYKLHSDNDNSLVFYLEEGTKSSLNVGLRFDSEEKASILLNTSIATKAFRGFTFDLTGRLSTNPYIMAGTTFTSNTFLKNVALSYKFKVNNNDIYFNGNKTSNISFNQHYVDFKTSGYYVNKFGITIGAFYEYLNYSTVLFSDSKKEYQLTPGGYLNLYGRALFENLDDSYFPRSGVKVKADYIFNTEKIFKVEGKNPFSAISFDFISALSISRRVTFIPSIYGRFLFGDDIPYPYVNFVGGTVKGRYRDQQIPFIGIDHTEPFDNSLMIGRLDFRVRLWRNHFVTMKGNYALSSMKLVNILNSKDVLGGGLEYAYNSILGPISAQVSISTQTRKLGFYISIGRYF